MQSRSQVPPLLPPAPPCPPRYLTCSRGQVCLSYGEKSNDVLALSYFFCLPDNPDDVYRIDDLAAAAAAAGVDADRLAELMLADDANSGSGRGRKVRRGEAAGGHGGCEVRRQGVDAASFALLCLTVASDDEYQRHLAAAASDPDGERAYLDGLGSALQRGWDPAGPGPEGVDRRDAAVRVRLSTRTVAAAHAAVAALCERELAAMPTSLEQDRALQAAAAAAAAAAGGQSTGAEDEEAAAAAERLDMALTFRMGKKELLRACAAASRRRANPYTRVAVFM